MTHQINLYDPALRLRREWLTLPNLAIAMAVVGVAVVAWGVLERARLAPMEQTRTALAAEAKTLQDEIAALGSRSGSAADAQAEAELAAMRKSLAEGREVVEILRQSAAPPSIGFSAGLKALARQTPRGLWLTGVTIAAGEGGAEIKGRMTDPALLSEFVRRLNAEAAFAGRSFAELQVGLGKPSEPGAIPAYHEFVLSPKMSKDGRP